MSFYYFINACIDVSRFKEGLSRYLLAADNIRLDKVVYMSINKAIPPTDYGAYGYKGIFDLDEKDYVSCTIEDPDRKTVSDIADKYYFRRLYLIKESLHFILELDIDLHNNHFVSLFSTDPDTDYEDAGLIRKLLQAGKELFAAFDPSYGMAGVEVSIAPMEDMPELIRSKSFDFFYLKDEPPNDIPSIYIREVFAEGSLFVRSNYN